MIRLFSVLFIVTLIALSALTQRAVAQQDDMLGLSFITPFPQGDVYKLSLIGDDLAEGLLTGVLDAFANDARLQIAPKNLVVNGVMRPDFDEKLAALDESLQQDTPNIAIVMLGAWDRVSARTDNGKKIPVGTPEWRAQYGAHIDQLAKILKRRGLAVYWVGLPNVRKADANEDAQMMNEVLRERVYLNGMKYIDAFAGFLDEDGGYDAWGPDLTGKIVRLRDGDGIYFTLAGNRKLAHFVERDLRRDLNQAKASRAVPLAGSEAEQEKINPDKTAVKDPDAPTPVDAASIASKAAASGGLSPSASGDQKADNGRISLKTVQTNGREEVTTIDIVRPAIPASVVALVTRKESADKLSQMGEVLIDQIGGGLNVMSTVTPPSGSAAGIGANAVSPTQTPFYRVLVKGERLTPKPGRADDQPWPRPEAVFAPTPGGASFEAGSHP